VKNRRFGEFSNTQIERLEFIDFCLDFYGRVSRHDMTVCLQLATASCTRDLAMYRELAPGNMEMRHQDKSYYRTENFQPLFFSSPQKSLENLTRYSKQLFENTSLEGSNLMFNLDNSLAYPPVEIISVTNRAIVTRSVMRIDYQSLQLGKLHREIVPLVMFNGYRGWYVRAYDQDISRFCDFALTNIESAELLSKKIAVGDSLEDPKWNTQVTLNLSVHPSVLNKRAVELMYKMTGGSLILETNEVVAAHLLKRENVEFEGCYTCETPRLLRLQSEVDINLSFEEL